MNSTKRIERVNGALRRIRAREHKRQELKDAIRASYNLPHHKRGEIIFFRGRGMNRTRDMLGFQTFYREKRK